MKTFTNYGLDKLIQDIKEISKSLDQTNTAFLVINFESVYTINGVRHKPANASMVKKLNIIGSKNHPAELHLINDKWFENHVNWDLYQWDSTHYFDQFDEYDNGDGGVLNNKLINDKNGKLEVEISIGDTLDVRSLDIFDRIKMWEVKLDDFKEITKNWPKNKIIKKVNITKKYKQRMLENITSSIVNLEQELPILKKEQKLLSEAIDFEPSNDSRPNKTKKVKK